MSGHCKQAVVIAEVSLLLASTLFCLTTDWLRVSVGDAICSTRSGQLNFGKTGQFSISGNRM